MARKAKNEPAVEAADESVQAEVPDSMMTDAVFQLPVSGGEQEVVLVGNFNGWSQESHPMSRNGEVFEIIVPLAKPGRYQYRYLIDGHRWENDWNADEYVANDFGCEDSVLVVT
jgi:1,4-alpha-glucan branching enzyme